MAKIVIIRDEGGIVAVEMHDGDWRKEAWQVVKSVKDGVALSRGRTDPLKSEQLEIDLRRAAADEVMASPRLTDEEKKEAYALLSGRVFHIDYYKFEFRPGEWARRHQVVDGGGTPTRPPIIRVIDP